MLEGISFLDLLLHVDKFLDIFISRYGVLVYVLIFIILFCETGLFCPFPGDSLIFAAAAYAMVGKLNIWILLIVCFVAAILGDSLNYFLGHAIGKKMYARAKGRFIKRENIDKAKEFYEKHGGKAIIFSRFIPIIRQFTPFVAGIGRMAFKRFMKYNFIGVTAWVGVSSLAGCLFGNIAFVRENFSTVILGIIIISLLPVIYTYVKSRIKKPIKSD